MIGTVCFSLCLIGVYLGKLIGKRFNSLASIIGGIVLILIGLKILLEHLLS